MKKAYVQAYDRIVEMLEDNTYPPGSALPTEVRLAQMVGTSRMTVRQALDLLQADGKIEKRKGSGNYVTVPNTDLNPGMSQLGNPIDKCLRTPYDRTVVEYEKEEANSFARNMFGGNTEDIISVYVYYYRGDELLAYTYAMLRGDVFGLVPEEEIRADFTNILYQNARRALIEIQFSADRRSLWPVKLKADERILFMTEHVIEKRKKVIAVNKHYLRQGLCRILLEAVK